MCARVEHDKGQLAALVGRNLESNDFFNLNSKESHEVFADLVPFL